MSLFFKTPGAKHYNSYQTISTAFKLAFTLLVEFYNSTICGFQGCWAAF
jgi:hypothetical protein